MLVSHKLIDRMIEGETENAGFILTNKIGGFFSSGINSRYRGLFFRFGNDIIKILDDIRTEGNIKELRNNFWNAERVKDSFTESFFMPFTTNSLVFEASKSTDIELFFDVKKAYDNREWGRIYNLEKEGNKVIVEFTKKTDSREDTSNDEKEYTIYTVVNFGEGSAELVNEWPRQEYGFDRVRQSYPAERHVFKGIKINSDNFVISSSESREEAVDTCNKARNNLSKFKELQKKYARVSIREISNNKINLAAKCAMESLDNLIVGENEKDIYAGLPWFFQFWARDSLISLKALMLDKEYSTVKKILMKYLNRIQDDGLLPNRHPMTETGSADAIGWLFKRLSEFMDILRRENQLGNYFTKNDIRLITAKLEKSIDSLFKNYTLDNFAINQEQETWMDSLRGETGRKGARIEIQALRMLMYDFLYKLTDRTVYKDMANKLIVKVREHFWNGSSLDDGLGDPTIRPNIFIAAYIYPELLSDDEWIGCIENAVPKLFLDWGGLSTIDKTRDIFYLESTGENCASYHNGDSWYWVNDLAALVMARLDYKKFKKYIDSILEASCRDILFNGFVGSHSETSSASVQTAGGCLSQAWSNALFVELAEELNDQGRYEDFQ
ncbi:hypothetical protein GF323_01955 [Candidatus Woesearchaeota archaeon]|nr:hypothetical protein [Candidatus Woesearchaeota archaeon]